MGFKRLPVDLQSEVLVVVFLGFIDFGGSNLGGDYVVVYEVLEGTKLVHRWGS
jgi:hypothetical protein